MFIIDLSNALKEEGLDTIQRIAANVWRNKQNATGAAINSLREEATNNSLTIYAIDYFKNLETGTKPGTYVSSKAINTWANAKGYWQGDNFRANTISRRIFNSGSKLFRDGGRTDVYTNEIPGLIQRIAEKAGKEIVNIKLIE